MIGSFFRNLCLLCFVVVVCLTITAVGSSEGEDMPDISDGSNSTMWDGSDEDRISLGDESDEASFPITSESAIFLRKVKPCMGCKNIF